MSPVNAPQCVRYRKDGRRCAARAANWGEPAPTANPMACWQHLTPAERETCLANRAGPPPGSWPPRRSSHRAPTSHSLRKSLNKAAFLLATETGRYPGAVNKELNDVMGVEQRREAGKEQLREGLRHVGDQLRALGKSRARPQRGSGVTFTGEPPF